MGSRKLSGEEVLGTERELVNSQIFSERIAQAYQISAQASQISAQISAKAYLSCPKAYPSCSKAYPFCARDSQLSAPMIEAAYP